MALPGAIPAAYRANFVTLLAAVEAGAVALVSALEVGTDRPAFLICAMQVNDDETITPVPFARLIDGNPFELFQDPTLMEDNHA